MKRLSLLAHCTALGLLGLVALPGCGSPDRISTPPAVADPNIVVLQGAQSNDFLLADGTADSGHLVARLRVDTRPVARVDRPRLNLALAIDTSGSMVGPAMTNARRAAVALVDELHDGDHLSVVTFGSTAELLLPLTLVSSDNRALLKKTISTMKARGTTAMTAGLANALDQANRGRFADGVNRIVLLSDGVPNDESALRPLADRAKQSEVAITALGLGLDYNETLLAELAERSGGSFHYVEKSTQVAQVFEKEIMRLEQIVARNLALQLTPGPGVTVREVIGYDSPRNGRSVRVGLGNLSAGEQLDVFVRLEVSSQRDGATVELLDALLTFQDAVVDAGNLRRDLFLSARATERDAALRDGLHEDVVREALRAELASVVVRAIASARSGNLAAAQELLITNAPRARKAALTYEDQSFATRADEMVELQASLPSIVPIVQRAPARRPAGLPGAGTADPSPAAAESAANVRRSHSNALSTIKRNRR